MFIIFRRESSVLYLALKGGELETGILSSGKSKKEGRSAVFQWEVLAGACHIVRPGEKRKGENAKRGRRSGRNGSFRRAKRRPGETGRRAGKGAWGIFVFRGEKLRKKSERRCLFFRLERRERSESGLRGKRRSEVNPFAKKERKK